MRRARMAWYVAVLDGVPSVVAQSSSTTGALQGSIKDTQGQVVPAARVRYQRVAQTVRVGNQTLAAPGEAQVSNVAPPYLVIDLPSSISRNSSSSQ